MSLAEELHRRTLEAQARIDEAERAERQRQQMLQATRYADRNDRIYGQFERLAKEAADQADNFLAVVENEQYPGDSGHVNYADLVEWDRKVCDFIREQGLNYSIQVKVAEGIPGKQMVSILAHW